MNTKERIEEVIFKYNNHVYSDEVEELLQIVLKAKKEVIDDISNYFNGIDTITINKSGYRELKKRQGI